MDSCNLNKMGLDNMATDHAFSRTSGAHLNGWLLRSWDAARSLSSCGNFTKTILVLMFALQCAVATGDERYKIVWDLETGKAQVGADGIILLPLPTDEPYQLNAYNLTGAKSVKVINEAGNRLLEVVPDAARLRYEVYVTFKAHRYNVGSAKLGTIPDDILPFLQPNGQFDPKSPKLAAVVKQVRSSSPADTVQKTRQWLKANIRYDFDPKTEDFRTVDDLIDRKFAECRGFSTLFLAVCRSCGVPARQVWGVSKRAPDFKPPGLIPTDNQVISHNWCEVYLGQLGWVPVEPQDPQVPLGQVPANRLRIIHASVNNPKSILASNNMGAMVPYAAASFVANNLPVEKTQPKKRETTKKPAKK